MYFFDSITRWAYHEYNVTTKHKLLTLRENLNSGGASLTPGSVWTTSSARIRKNTGMTFCRWHGYVMDDSPALVAQTDYL